MYLTRILVTVLILVPLTLAATITIRPTSGKPTTAGNPTTSVKLPQTIANPSKMKASTSKDRISLRLGENSPANNNRGKIIITLRLGSNGNPKEQWQCTLYNLGVQSDVVTITINNGQQCEDSTNVCCRVPLNSLTTDEPAIPQVISENPVTIVTQQPPSNSQSNCTCVPPAQCSDAKKVISGAGLINPREFTPSCVAPDICCPPESITGGVTGYRPTPATVPIPNPDPQPPYVPTPHTQPPPGNSQPICICVPSAQCGVAKKVISGAGLINPRFSCTSPDICCPPESIIGGVPGSTPTPAPAPVQPPSVEPNTNPLPPITFPTPTPTHGNPPTVTGSDECGIRVPSIDNRIIAPEHLAHTSFGEFPWMAMILAREITSNGTVIDNVFVCGASLLSPSVVLTAAHCVANLSPDRLRIRVGEYNTRQDASETMTHQERPVFRILVHPKFDNEVLFNDIALIKVAEDFVLAPHIAPICISVTNSQFADPSSYDPNNCLATGWGKNAFLEGNYQTTLKRVDLALIEQSECQKRLRETVLAQQFILDSSFVCAGGQPGFDTCQGDGGGPLVCASRVNRNQYVQVGIVSWGIGCASSIPGVYASLYANQGWLSMEYNFMSVFRMSSG